MRVLVNFTRPVEEREKRDEEGNLDEISKYWLKPEDEYEPVLERYTNDEQQGVLVINGRKGNGDLAKKIEAFLAGSEETGLLYHSRGRDSEQEEGIRTVLPNDVELDFFENYSSDDSTYHLYEKLARTSRDEDGFAEAFGRICEDFAPDRSLEVKLNLLHELLVPPSSKKEIEAKGDILMEGVKNDPEASEEEERKCEQAWEKFVNAGPQDYSDDPFNEKYYGSEDKEGMLEKLRDGLFATAS